MAAGAGVAAALVVTTDDEGLTEGTAGLGSTTAGGATDVAGPDDALTVDDASISELAEEGATYAVELALAALLDPAGGEARKARPIEMRMNSVLIAYFMWAPRSHVSGKEDRRARAGAGSFALRPTVSASPEQQTRHGFGCRTTRSDHVGEAGLRERPSMRVNSKPKSEHERRSVAAPWGATGKLTLC
jgi:hypothetical protein